MTDSAAGLPAWKCQLLVLASAATWLMCPPRHLRWDRGHLAPLMLTSLSGSHIRQHGRHGSPDKGSILPLHHPAPEGGIQSALGCIPLHPPALEVWYAVHTRNGSPYPATCLPTPQRWRVECFAYQTWQP